MRSVYVSLRNRARQIVSRCPQPDFYADCAAEVQRSRDIFESDLELRRLRGRLADELEDDFGHGLRHAVRVALDAGALMLVESEDSASSPAFVNRRVIVVQSAGLLHDIRRKHPEHSICGATVAGRLLADYSFSQEEVNDICIAIRCHEAFKESIPPESPAGILVSDCLYDADKFRWGPDNFSDTLWDMLRYANPEFAAFVSRYPAGMERLETIKDSFRTRTGRRYGPQFIEIGLSIGKELLEVIYRDYGHLL
ncbi:MAG: hypothetical protein AMJ54_00780 [Deltaproteobacteria bacterium SG8_13]|nr:MAG: hypothetical protein AMJ54_00780 [Deltaproteobacteria bacterium SG8_13]